MKCPVGDLQWLIDIISYTQSYQGYRVLPMASEVGGIGSVNVCSASGQRFFGICRTSGQIFSARLTRALAWLQKNYALWLKWGEVPCLKVPSLREWAWLST